MGGSVFQELCDFSGLTADRVQARMDLGTRGTADSYNDCADDADRWYRETDAYLYELANWEGDETIQKLAAAIGERLSALPYPVLDYGCGIGSFALLLAEKGLQVVACDVNLPNRQFLEFRAERRQLSSRLKVVLPEDALAGPKAYSLISCQHVLEHVEDPLALLRRLHDSLTSGGLFIGVAPFDLIGPEFPEHRVELSHLTLEGLCEEVGFAQIGTQPINLFTMVKAVKGT